MTRFGILLALILAWSAPGHADQQSIDFWIVQSDPGLSASLARNEGLYVRLAYRSDRPVRFRMRGYANGVEVTKGAMYNGAPPYPPGEGEALVWIGYHLPVHIDEIRISALDATWQPLLTSNASTDLSWSAAGGRHQPAAWATRMSSEQQEAIRHQIERDSGSGGALVFFLLVAGVLGYFVLQPLTVLWLNGPWRAAAAAPLIATVPLMLHAALAFAAGANLWPILLIFCLPLAALYLLALASAHSLAAERAAT